VEKILLILILHIMFDSNIPSVRLFYISFYRSLKFWFFIKLFFYTFFINFLFSFLSFPLVSFPFFSFPFYIFLEFILLSDIFNHVFSFTDYTFKSKLNLKFYIWNSSKKILNDKLILKIKISNNKLKEKVIIIIIIIIINRFIKQMKWNKIKYN
jgi:hypothetical protein